MRGLLERSIGVPFFFSRHTKAIYKNKNYGVKATIPEYTRGYTGKRAKPIQRKVTEKTYHPTNNALENAQKNSYKRKVLISN